MNMNISTNEQKEISLSDFEVELQQIMKEGL
jgi:hypothetical protein